MSVKQRARITDLIFDFIGSLDDSHLMAASRTIKAAIKERQQSSKFEMLASLLKKTQINCVSVEHIKSDATMNIDHTPQSESAVGCPFSRFN